MTTTSREKMVRAAAQLIRRRGLTATAFSDVIARSGAPRGSIYHHFPRGKAQLAEEAVRWAGQAAVDGLQDQPAHDPHQVLETWIDLWRRVVESSSGAAGCVIAGATLDAFAEAPEALPLLDAARDALSSWSDLLADRLIATGVPGQQARPVAVAAVAALEGALLLCRAHRSTEPLETVAAQLHRLLPGSAPQAPGG